MARRKSDRRARPVSALAKALSLALWVGASACPAEPSPEDAVPAVNVDGATPQNTPIPTGDANDGSRPQITALHAPEIVSPGQIVTLRIVTDFPVAEDIVGVALVIEGVEGWLLAEPNPSPATVSDPGKWVITVPVTVAEAFTDSAVARVSVALLGPGQSAGAYQSWNPELNPDAPLVNCPGDADCEALACGADPVCSTSCGDCSAAQACSAAGVCESIGNACPDAAVCGSRACGPDPVCGTDCGSCGPGEQCSDAGVCTTTQGAFVSRLGAGATRDHNCAIFDDGQVACWGHNAGGQLGVGDLEHRGDQSGELGEGLALADVGGEAQLLALGDAHSCVETSDGALRCWGDGTAGALGRGDTKTIGDQAGELPGALIDVELPIGNLEALCLGGQFGCALDGDGEVACWGANGFGQLGQGDTDARGDQPGELGSSLATIDLPGAAASIHCGRHFACARVGSAMYCWGRNDWGQLGVGDTENRGDDPDEMGSNLVAVPLGAGRTPRLITTGSHHSCVVLDDDSVKCWGQGFWGNLGLESDLVFGDTPDSTPDQLPALELGRDGEIEELSAGDRHTCARFEDDEVRCWGYPWALGVGDAEGRGARPGTMGQNLEPAVLSGLALTQMVAGADFTCALSDNGRVQCWGFNLSGQLGVGDTQTRGDEPGEMGNALPFTDL